ncbi:MAG: cbb3-type cytochrome oxidase assembly protein CcoS [Marinoscillum sp.]
MSVIIVLIGFSLMVATGFLVAFVWASNDGQYDDDYTPSVRILFDEEKKQPNHVKRDFSKRKRGAKGGK